MNYVNDVLEMLGVEIGERFKLKNKEDYVFVGEFSFDKNLKLNIYDGDKICFDNEFSLDRIICGQYKIIKLPFKPKHLETYYYFDDGRVYNTYWENKDVDFVWFNIGNCFRTEQEAETKGRELMEKLRAEYENE